METQNQEFAEQTQERVDAYFEEVSKARDEATKQAHGLVDDMAKLAKYQIDYAQKLGSEWQRIFSASSKQYGSFLTFPWNR